MASLKSESAPRPGRQPQRVASKHRERYWTGRLDVFRIKFGLSVEAFARLLPGIIRRSHLQDVLAGRRKTRCEDLMKPAIAQRLRQFMREQRKMKPLEIEREIVAIFNDPLTINKENESMLTQRTTLPKPAQTFFGLRRDPFTSDPLDHSEVFTTPHLNRVVDNLLDAIRYQGFCGALGEVGSGKSMLKRRLMDQCQKSKGALTILWPQFFNMEKVHAGSICSFVLRHFNAPAPRDLVARAERLKQVLGDLADEGKRVALGFDECHRLHPNLLTALKNFWELGSGGFDRYLGLILFGQPHFEGILHQPNFREIYERLDILRVPSLGRDAEGYLAHRLSVVGGKLDKLFEPAAVARLVKLANGKDAIATTPLALGNVANAAMVEAFKMQHRRVPADLVPELNGHSQVRGVRKAVEN
jgi:type II secretory pathway predicted ATPase ExeA